MRSGWCGTVVVIVVDDDYDDDEDFIAPLIHRSLADSLCSRVIVHE